jgi:hypothetical protein
MAEHLTTEQARSKSTTAMPAPLGEIYHWLHDELAWLHIKWSNFCRLYAKDRERVDLLNAAAPTFFSELRQTLLEDVLLHLCRITDQPKSGRHDHLTFKRIPAAIPDAALRAAIQPLVADTEHKTKFARDWRNRRLAHRELPAPHGQAAQPLPEATRQDVEDALTALRKVMNQIERHYLNESVLYEHSIEALGGVESLVKRLTSGLAAEKNKAAQHRLT